VMLNTIGGKPVTSVLIVAVKEVTWVDARRARATRATIFNILGGEKRVLVRGVMRTIKPNIRLHEFYRTIY